MPIRRGEHNARPLDVLARTVAVGRDRRQLLAIRGAQNHTYLLCHGPSPKPWPNIVHPDDVVNPLNWFLSLITNTLLLLCPPGQAGRVGVGRHCHKDHQTCPTAVLPTRTCSPRCRRRRRAGPGSEIQFHRRPQRPSADPGRALADAATAVLRREGAASRSTAWRGPAGLSRPAPIRRRQTRAAAGINAQPTTC